MAMRFDGKLEKWDDDRGFGFITPAHGGEPVFVHISAFQHDGRRPRIGEPLTFEVELAGDGKKRAVNVQRPGRRATAQAQRQSAPEQGRNSGLPLRSIAIGLALLAVGGYAYMRFAGIAHVEPAVKSTSGVTSAPPTATPASSRFQCDGRTRCSQMTSCDEAKFFLQNCPGTQMDGNGDGIPCEKQWCNGFSGR
jgi:cold shock CspA family protein